MISTRKTDLATGVAGIASSEIRSDLIKKIIVQKFLGFMFHPKFGIADHLKIPRTDSIEDFSRFFSPHGARTIRVALKLKDNSLISEVKKHLVGKTVSTGMQTNESKLDGMPEGISIDEVKKAEKELTPIFAKMFGIDGTPSEYELHVVTNLVLGVLQREKYGLDLNTPDEKLLEHMMK